VNCLSRVLDVPVPAPTLVTTSDRPYVPHLLVGSVAVQRYSLISFITQTSKPSLDLFPRNCTYVEVIGFRIMVLWSIGFITNRHRILPHQISLCPLLLGPDQSHYNQSRRWSRLHTTLAQITRIAPKWIYTVLKIFSQFTIFVQLALALKITELLWKFSL